jgi:hypothetical protein
VLVGGELERLLGRDGQLRQAAEARARVGQRMDALVGHGNDEVDRAPRGERVQRIDEGPRGSRGRGVDDALGAAWAVVGGLAVSARAEPRLTRDVDVAIAVESDAKAEALVRALVGQGYWLLAQIELLFASSGIEPELVAAAERMEIAPGLSLPIARTGHLIAMKLLARDDRNRPQDADDLRALRTVATPGELERAAQAVAMIVERGFARGRDLAALLDALIDEYRG